MEGVIIVSFVLVSNILAAFIISGSGTGTAFGSCNPAARDNATACQGTGETGFFSALASVTFLGSFGDGTPLIINVLWVSIMGLLLTAAIILIVLSFLPTYSG